MSDSLTSIHGASYIPDSEHKACSIYVHQLVVITPHRIEVIVNINACPNDTSIIRYCTARYPAVVVLIV